MDDIAEAAVAAARVAADEVECLRGADATSTGEYIFGLFGGADGELLKQFDDANVPGAILIASRRP